MNIKRSKSIDQIIDTFDPGALDQENILVAAETQLPEALTRYDEILSQGIFYVNVDNRVTAILTNEELNLFLKIADVHKHRVFHRERLGPYVSLLVQNAYEKGTSRFSLDFRHTKDLYGVGEYILGKPERPINLYVDGDVGWNFGCSSEYVEFTLDGEVQPGAGYHATYCIFKTSRRETVEQFLKHLPEKDSYGRKTNKIVFIKADGSEEVVEEKG